MVGAAGGLAIWNNADRLTADVAPSETLATPSTPTALALGPDALLVGLESSQVLVFDAPRTVSGTTSPRATLTVDGGVKPVVELFAADGDLWVLLERGKREKWKGLATVTASSPEIFVESDGSGTNDALYAPFIDTIYNVGGTGAGTSLGQTGAPDSPPTIHRTAASLKTDGSVPHLAAGGATLFIGQGDTVDLRGNRSLLSNFAVDASLPAGSGPVVKVSVQHDTLIILTTEEISLFKEASTLIARQPMPERPDSSVLIPGMIDAVLDSHDRLYVLYTGGLLIFDDALNTRHPMIPVSSGISNPTALTLVE
jgi:hypothetical protein